jgi:hypothetical protein
LNWRPIASEAAQRYLSWLARDNIIFFFNTILPNTNEKGLLAALSRPNQRLSGRRF